MTTHLRARARLVPAPRTDHCLEFADTRYWRGSEQPTETMAGVGDLLAWCEATKSLDKSTTVDLAVWSRRNKREADHVFDEAMGVREILYRVFSATASAKAVSADDVDALNGLLERAPGRTSISITKAGNLWRLPPASPTAASLLAPVLWSAGDLLVGERLGSVRLCANKKCGWLFLDDSKSGTRRWCTMSACGNRAKAQRHYRRRIKPAADAVS